MKILFLNRRDIINPDSGGAEVYTHEIAKGLVEKYNCTVSVFASHFSSGKKEEIVDGVKYIRNGSEFSVHLRGFLYAVRHRKQFELIIDEFNGSGFFTFLLSNSILLIHQLYKEFWLWEWGVLGIVPYVLEPVMLKLYKNKMAITVSNSTKDDLQRLGFKNIRIIMNGLKNPPLDSSPKKTERPTMVFLGRLKSTKRPEDAIEIFIKIKEKISNAQLWIIGRGPDEKKLQQKAAGIDGITFWGWVDEGRKIELLRKAHILLVPGAREGFGINVIEAASAGTPSVGYNVHGLRDAIIHGETGFLVNNMNEAASAVIEIFSKNDFYQKISQNCLNYARDFDWDKRAEEFWQKISMGKDNGKQNISTSSNV